MAKKNVSVDISYLLRHNPGDIGLEMDRHGWVSVVALIDGVNKKGKYTLNRDLLEEIVKCDSKGRYRFNADHTRIKACQGHSIPWVEPELEILTPPKFLYHGTTTIALEKILKSGAISKMGRHAVHMQADPAKAWQSATRWHQTPVILKIDAEEMSRCGYSFGKTENDVWCTESVPNAYIVEQITEFESPSVANASGNGESDMQQEIDAAVGRIRQMEACFDALQEDASLQGLLQDLLFYYESGKWLQDYELDEKGLLPADLKRGVLAQDAVYDFLDRMAPVAEAE